MKWFLFLIVAFSLGQVSVYAQQAPTQPAAKPTTPVSTCEDDKRLLETLIKTMRDDRANSEVDAARRLENTSRSLQQTIQQLRAENAALKKPAAAPAEPPAEKK